MNTTIKQLTKIRSDLQGIDNKALAQSKAFKEFLLLQDQLQAEINQTWELIKEQMLAYDVKKIDGDWGYIQIAERRNFTGDNDLAPRFYKQVVDSSKIASYMNISGKLPRGAKLSTTKYLRKQIKAGK